jgi:aryl-alcohol dehydrogenase-like predicted oxidoreductase
MNHRGFGALEAMDKIAADRGATMAQVALAWLLGRPAVAAAIVGINSVEQWNEIAPAVDLALTSDEIAVLDRATGPT